MHVGGVRFSITSHAAWGPGVESAPSIKTMPALLRRRASLSGKMALETAYHCLGTHSNIPIIFCSRHGECGRAADLLSDLVRDTPISPTSFSLSVHNAIGGLFSIARQDHANSLALAAGQSTIEHAVIEACGLLADNEPAVLLVAYDSALPTLFAQFQECNEQFYAWAWLIQAPKDDVISLTWSPTSDRPSSHPESEPAGLEIFRFFTHKNSNLERISNGQRWQWTHHV